MGAKFRFELHQSGDNQFYSKIVCENNGQTIWTSETYTTLLKCCASVDSFTAFMRTINPVEIEVKNCINVKEVK